MMNKKSISLLALGVVAGISGYAQSVGDGVKALYSGKYDAAVSIFQKNATDPQATYWLAETFFEQGKNAKANEVIAKAAQPTNPWVLVAKGHSLLADNKVAEAKQSFESAVTAAGKGEDKARILNAVGDAITEVFNNVTKIGDISYAVQKLQEAKGIVLGMKEKSRDNLLLADIHVNLGDALLKQTPGDGGRAYAEFRDALALEPTFAPAHYRKAKIARSQKNVEEYINLLNEATRANPGFLPAYEDLFWYYFGFGDYKTAQMYADKIIANSEPSPTVDYYKATALYFGKDYKGAISSGKAIIAKAGDNVDPKVYKLVAYSYIESGDTASAVPFVQDYFKTQKKDKIVPKDYTMMAAAYSATAGKETEIVNAYMDGVKADTSVDNKVTILEEGANFFAGKGKLGLAGDLYSKIIEVKPKNKLTINDYFNAGYKGYFQAKQYDKAWAVFDAARTQFPKWNYGYRFTFSSSSKFDSTNAQNKMVPDAEKYVTFLQSDTAPDARPQIFTPAWAAAQYYINVKNDKVNGLKYLRIAHDAVDDPGTKQQLQNFIKQLGGSSASGGSGPSTKAGASTAKPKA